MNNKQTFIGRVIGTIQGTHTKEYIIVGYSSLYRMQQQLRKEGLTK